MKKVILSFVLCFIIVLSFGQNYAGSTTSNTTIVRGNLKAPALPNKVPGATDSSIIKDAAGNFYSTAITGGGSVTGSLINVQYLTASGTYTPTTGTTRILVQMLAGGGGGGGGASTVTGVNVSAGGGGGSGGYIQKYITPVSGSYTYTIGSGGSAGFGSANGSIGGNTTFVNGATTYSCFGGEGGTFVPSGNTLQLARGGNGGGTSGNGDINSQGNVGTVGIGYNSTQSFPGTGAGSPFGGGGQGTTNGSGYGSGGGGSANPNGTSDRAGGNGAPGIIIIYEFK